jgi:protein O-mannosyl-transferase
MPAAGRKKRKTQPANRKPLRVEAAPARFDAKKAIPPAIALAALTVAVYIPALRCQFVNYDDNHYVTENAQVRRGLTLGTIRWALTSLDHANWHPVTWISHALDVQLFGMNPAGHHATSVLVHAVNVALLFLLLWRATGAIDRSGMVAAMFALHPINVESVAWIAERKNLLCTLFFLLALGAYGWYARRPGVQRYLLVTALFALGLASKPMVITLPLVLLLLDYWPLRRIEGWTTPSSWDPIVQGGFGKLVLEKVPWLLLSAASAIVTVAAQRAGGAMAPTGSVPFSAKLSNSIHSYVAYLGKAFWPARLAPFYPGAPVGIWEAGLAAGFLIAVSWLAWRRRLSRPYLVIGWLWYVGTIFPVIGLVQAGGQAMADRFAYIPLIGIFVAVVWGIGDWASERRIPTPVMAGAAGVMVLTLSVVTIRQISYWRDSIDLWSHTLAVTKNNLVAEDNLGVAQLAVGDEADAVKHFQNAVKINPLDPFSHVNIGAAYEGNKQWRAALAEYETAASLTREPDLQLVIYRNLGRVYRQLGDLSRAIESYQQALAIDPQEPAAFLAVGALQREQRIRDLQAELKEHASADEYFELGQLFQQAGRTEDARNAYQESVKLGDESGRARKALSALP